MTSLIDTLTNPQSIVTLPLYPGMSHTDQDRVVDTLQRFTT